MQPQGLTPDMPFAYCVRKQSSGAAIAPTQGGSTMNTRHEPYADTQEIAREIVTTTQAQGGGTFNRKGGEYEGSHGYVIGGARPGITLNNEAPVDAIILLTARWLEQLPVNTSTVGGWIDDGTIHLDAVDVVDSYTDAYLTAVERGEKAIYSLHEGREYRTS